MVSGKVELNPAELLPERIVVKPLRGRKKQYDIRAVLKFVEGR